MDGWILELSAAGYTPEGMLDDVTDAAANTRSRRQPQALSARQLTALAAYAVGPSGRLAQQKVFTRSDVAVALGPLLFGFTPRELLRAVEAVCGHPDAVALLDVKAAREQAYASACVIATEAAIALKVALQADLTRGPAVGVEVAERAIAAKEEQLGGRPLTADQRDMIRSVLTSGRPVELIVGVAGAGKTTALDAARQAFEAAGYRVVGTSISGQATRTLGTDAGIGESRTVASLLWRIDHRQTRLDRGTVVVCDEAGMTDDANMLRLLAATEAAGSKLIIVGDHRQLGAVGPGGSLQALVNRHQRSVHALSENVRQTDPEERAVLAHLRTGSVEAAVNWYAEHDRITTAPTREQALDHTVGAWAQDIADGRQATMMAWRKANVAALNTRAQQAVRQAGRLSGPELAVGANLYQAGDLIVTLAPSAGGQLVTSQRGQVTAVDPEAASLWVRMDDGHIHTLGPGQTGPDHLALGYATTVHRSQGATFDSAHLYADGGGRELGYVAMSRARQTVHVHTLADNIYQAVEELTWDWSRERRQAWAIDTGTPETQGRPAIEIEADKQAPQKLRDVLSRARLKAERTALEAAASDQLSPTLRRQVAGLDRHIQLLDQRLEPSTNRFARQPLSTPVEAPAPELPSGPTL
jgi:hypothetical protein